MSKEQEEVLGEMAETGRAMALAKKKVAAAQEELRILAQRQDDLADKLQSIIDRDAGVDDDCHE